MATREPKNARLAAGSTEVLDECFVVDICVDRYLWALYQRTPKEDTVRTQEQRKVTVKRKGRLVTITKTFTTHADEDFSWKDPKDAENAGMTLEDYVIGGMDRDFKLKLFHMLHTADEAGLAPGITSAFRDDHRQSIASGLKAANDRSYHGGSFRGGYGHGLAADIVSVKARHGHNDLLPVKLSGTGSMHTARSLESDGLISIETRRMWHRSTGKNMLVTTPC